MWFHQLRPLKTVIYNGFLAVYLEPPASLRTALLLATISAPFNVVHSDIVAFPCVPLSDRCSGRTGRLCIARHQYSCVSSGNFRYSRMSLAASSEFRMRNHLLPTPIRSQATPHLSNRIFVVTQLAVCIEARPSMSVFAHGGSHIPLSNLSLICAISSAKDHTAPALCARVVAIAVIDVPPVPIVPTAGLHLPPLSTIREQQTLRPNYDQYLEHLPYVFDSASDARCKGLRAVMRSCEHKCSGYAKSL